MAGLATRTIGRLPVGPRVRIGTLAHVRAAQRPPEEKVLGLRPVLRNAPARWLSPFLPLSYTKVWSHLGVRGLNYVSFVVTGSDPEPLPLVDPRSRYYHSWFGVYAVSSTDRKLYGFSPRGPDPMAFEPLIIADQEYWQRVIVGSTVGTSTFTVRSSAQVVSLPFLAERCYLFFGAISSHSVLVPPDMQTQRARSFVRLPSPNSWERLVEPGHAIEQAGFVVLWADEEHSVTYCAYGVAANFVDRQGTSHRNVDAMEGELLSLVGCVRLRRTRR